MRSISFVVYGTPRPQGSMRTFMRPGMKFPVVTTDNKNLKPWRQQIAGVIVGLNEIPFEAHVPLRCRVDCYFNRPKSISPKKRPGMTTKPDGDKLMRALWDSMKGILVHDDSQFVDGRVRKFYGGHERIEVTISDECE